MDCGVDTIETVDENGVTRGIEIEPKGCLPVSTDECKSGFMAPTDNVSFPKNSLPQCCKCKTGETCLYCNNPSECTTEEQVNYVTDENCFADSNQSSTPPSEQTQEEGEENEEENENVDENKEKINLNYLIGALICIGFLMMFVILFSR